jgi:hypothetical protein
MDDSFDEGKRAGLAVQWLRAAGEDIILETYGEVFF